jgi:polyisoprenoid-binding protein YceI
MSISGRFNQWDAGLTFASTDASTGVLDIKVQAASVNTGSGMKDRTLRSANFFDADNNPLITFRSTRIAKTGADTFEVDGNFTVRGVTKQEKLTLTVSGAGTGQGTIQGTMAFNRRDYGMNGSVPLVRIPDRVEVTVNLNVRRVSGPPLTFKQ